jgi:hypothetical protein
VRIRNYGDRAIIGPAVEGASLHKRPDAQWMELNEWIDILPPYRESALEGTLPLRFFDAEGDPVPKLLALVGDMEPLFEDVDETPIVAVHVMDADGLLDHWSIHGSREGQLPTTAKAAVAVVSSSQVAC